MNEFFDCALGFHDREKECVDGEKKLILELSDK
jgi:hypothetical protein